MKIVITRVAKMSDPASARIVLEGTEVLRDLNVPRTCALLMGLRYVFTLSYPKELENTLKIFLELGGLKASLKLSVQYSYHQSKSDWTSDSTNHRLYLSLSLNVRSTLVLTAGFLQVFPCRLSLRQSIVNILSVFALQALQSWVLYCSAKAARKMIFNVLVEEEPHVKVLSYSPGPVDTEKDIQRLTGISYHLLTCQKSAAKLMKLLLDSASSSGTHFDSFAV